MGPAPAPIGPRPGMSVRIGLSAGGELEWRTFFALTAEPGVDVELLEEGKPSDGEWDALAVDKLSPASRPWWERAREGGIPTVLASSLPAADARNPTPETTAVSRVLAGENLAAALAEAAGWTPGATGTRLAWTVSGPPLGAGEAVNFPPPTGPRWAGLAQGSSLPGEVAYLAAPVDDSWMALLADVNGAATAVADDAGFLRGIFLAAAALAAARGAYPPGPTRPADPAGTFLRIAQKMGLQIATHAPVP